MKGSRHRDGYGGGVTGQAVGKQDGLCLGMGKFASAGTKAADMDVFRTPVPAIGGQARKCQYARQADLILMNDGGIPARVRLG
ncbi:hypothetical protein Gxy13693_239_027 [Komagataeibacter xylinus NBRC 13693]|uniref:Uncharacterized protein n=2 Tax=Komagataeibacter TaxID=1434011 RepID=A0A0D6QCA6_KOMXY|nr:hypothetical protein CFR80_03220 [Komagataeibacter oboediens]GAO01143.1 hypothetical protein Gxy13693_239_027 [Komagataeibacter xylinus NBRC 13693]GBQ05125.1 hypothetical protein AA11826_2148 [Komagataeibacter oboediens DSM 11826]